MSRHSRGLFTAAYAGGIDFWIWNRYKDFKFWMSTLRFTGTFDSELIVATNRTISLYFSIGTDFLKKIKNEVVSNVKFMRHRHTPHVVILMMGDPVLSMIQPFLLTKRHCRFLHWFQRLFSRDDFERPTEGDIDHFSVSSRISSGYEENSKLS